MIEWLVDHGPFVILAVILPIVWWQASVGFRKKNERKPSLNEDSG